MSRPAVTAPNSEKCANIPAGTGWARTTRCTVASRTGADPERRTAASRARPVVGSAATSVPRPVGTTRCWASPVTTECVPSGVNGASVTRSKEDAAASRVSSIRRSRANGSGLGPVNRSVPYRRRTSEADSRAARRRATSSWTVVRSAPGSAASTSAAVPPGPASTRRPGPSSCPIAQVYRAAGAGGDAFSGPRGVTRSGTRPGGNLIQHPRPVNRGGPVSAGQIAALIAAGAFVVLVVLLAIPLIKLGKTLDAATEAIERTNSNTDPLLIGANQTITHVNTQLERVDGITSNAQAVTGNVSALTSVFTATLGGPLVKTAALSYGLSKAITRAQEEERREGREEGRQVKRLFWLGVGVVTGVVLSRKAAETARQATPAGLASNLGDAVRELAGAVGSFGAEVRAGHERAGAGAARHGRGADGRGDAAGVRPARRRPPPRPASSPGGALTGRARATRGRSAAVVTPTPAPAQGPDPWTHTKSPTVSCAISRARATRACPARR